MAGTINSWGNQIAGSSNQIILNAGTNGVAISTDASATTVNIASGAGVKTTTLGSTNTTSSTAIKSGTGNVVINSGLTIDSTGRNYNTVQPAFQAYLSATVPNATGDGTAYQLICDTELFDQGNNYNNATGVFTAPVTGLYMFTVMALESNITASFTTTQLEVITTASSFQLAYGNPGAAIAEEGFYGCNGATMAKMTAGDTCVFKVIVTGGTKTVGIYGPVTGQIFTYVSGHLVC